MTLFLGDSLTRGLVGRSYIRFLPKGSGRNRGRDGDTAHGALRRLKRYRKRRWYGDVKDCVVEIGTNDILQPFLMSRGAVWRAVFGWKRPWKLWAGAEEYERVMREILDILTGDKIRPVIMGLPLMQLKGYPLREIRERNAMLRSLASEYGAAFADVYGAETAACPDPRTDYDWGRTGLARVVDIITMGLLPFTKDWFSRHRGLELTVDGVHFNTFSGRIAAEALAGHIETAG